MNIGVLREKDPLDRRVALTPAVVRQLVERGNAVWVQSGAGDGAMYRDDEFLRAGARIGYSKADVIGRSDLLVRISVPEIEELDLCRPGIAVMAFYHMAVAGHAVFERLLNRRITALGCEIIETPDGKHPVLAAASELCGRMAIPLAAHLLLSSSGGRGVLLGGAPGVPPAHVVVLGAGVVGTRAARAATAAGAQVTILDIDSEKLRDLVDHVPHLATALADPDSVAAAVAAADVVIGAVLVAGARAPQVVTKKMVESMRPGSVIIDIAIDQGGCVETSRPTTLAEPSFIHHGVVHFCTPNMTADIGRSASIALSQAMLPYLVRLGELGVEGALAACPQLARGVYTHRGECVHRRLAAAWKAPYRPVSEVLAEPVPAARQN
ncbi:MAG TPA: NAD(P)-binding domain-containing protein [Bryobacteraceae bacterium]|nr:NAD(P)-binding domain-containing protein [Bryobacteraceae bacterium]